MLNFNYLTLSIRYYNEPTQPSVVGINDAFDQTFEKIQSALMTGALMVSEVVKISAGAVSVRSTIAKGCKSIQGIRIGYGAAVSRRW